MESLSGAAAPSLSDLTSENITENVIKINSSSPDARLRFVLERLVTHLHDFTRETQLSTDEWMAGIKFLTATGQKCTDVRQEFILLSDILGLSLLIDSIDHPKPDGSTEGTVLGPFHTDDAETIVSGEKISHDENGDPLLVICTVNDVTGRPVSGVNVDIWETDSSGHYDVQHTGRTKPDGRCVIHSDANGKFWLKAIVPVPYPIPNDGPVGQLLGRLNRHCWRPAHMHFMFNKPGALYLKGDPYETSDAVFGVKNSLVVDLAKVSDPKMMEEYGVREGAALLQYKFVLVSNKESHDLRERNNTRSF